MEVRGEWEHSEEVRGFSMERRLLLRCGRVKAYHPDGHILCRGPCIETTIPVFAGMSGAPVALLAADDTPISPFGVVSHDPETSHGDKWDRSAAGASIVALLSPRMSFDGPDGQRKTILRLNSTLASFKTT